MLIFLPSKELYMYSILSIYILQIILSTQISLVSSVYKGATDQQIMLVSFSCNLTVYTVLGIFKKV